MLFEIFNKAYYKDSIIDKIYRGDTLIYQFGRATQNQSLTAIIIEDINYSVSAQSLNTSTSGYLETIYYNISAQSLNTSTSGYLETIYYNISSLSLIIV